MSSPKIALGNFQKKTATAGTKVALQAASFYAGHVVIRALSGNTKPVYIGDSTVSASAGHELAAGDTYKLPEDKLIDLSTVFLDSQVNAEGVSVAYIKEV